MNTLAAPYNEAATTEELVFALARRDQPTVAFVECASLAKRNELETLLAARLPEYQFFLIDVTPFPVVSLLRTLGERLPAAVRESAPVSYVVNVHGLENSLLISQDGQLVPSLLTAQLNLERELLFHNVPYIIILWGDAHFFRTLQREAPDLWHWVAYHFRFEDHTARSVDSLPPLPPERLPQQGNIAERQARITELEGRYAHLSLDSSDKKRLLKDKANIQRLLAEEYTEAFAYDKAVEAYKRAIALHEILLADDETQGELLFNLAMVYCQNQQFDNSLVFFQDCKLVSTEENYGAIYHGMGMVYAEQKDWSLALLNYRQALSWNKKVGKLQELGTTHFQIGILYAEQEEWITALHHYRKSITLDQDNGNGYMRGSAYSQIGKVYAKQRQWSLALENFKQAVFWKREHGNTFSVGITYYQIGQAYQEQGEINLALEAYQDALEWDTKTGNDIRLGATYFQIGTVYEIQEKFSEAQEWYEKAMVNLAHHSHPAHPIAAAALGRVRETQG